MSTSKISDEYTELANVKKEVAELQCKILKEELKFKEKEYNLKIDGLIMDNKIKQLQIKLLEKQCNREEK